VPDEKRAAGPEPLGAAEMRLLLPLLDKLLDLPDEAAREHWLDALPPEQSALVPRLRRMLVARGPGQGLLDRSVVTAMLSAGPRLHAGDRVGPYALVRELGQGGMSEVSLASQRFLERLARERAILERLDHPGIARLIDAGVGEGGQQYLALEYVDGLPLDRHAAAHALGIDARIDLVMQVLEVLHYAHGRGVLHRDLKPSNILVTAAGRARLLDFGIAKILVDGEARETELTERWGRALTPAYASPEQRRGQGVTVRSDLYSIGVLLYELLAGVRPGTDADDVPPPSRVVAAEGPIARAEGGVRAARRRLAGDLDELVMRTLERDPARRPTDARALADALAGVRRGDPLHGMTRRAWRPIGDWLRRRRVLLATTAPAWLLVAAWPGVHGLAARIEAAWTPALPADHRVVLVTIGAADRRQLFGSPGPLDPAVVKRLVQRIVDGGPAVLGVDLDTSAPGFATLRASPVGTAGNVVWARDLATRDEGAAVRPRDVLGGADAPPPIRTALAVTLQEDGRLRWYARGIDTDAGRLRGLGPVLAGSANGDAAIRSIHFGTPERVEFPASVVLANGFDWGDRLRGRIVALGGRYDSTDVHATPLGIQDGIDVLASIAETEIADRGYVRPGLGMRFALGVAPLLATLAFLDGPHASRAGLLALAVCTAAFAAGAVALVAAGVAPPWPYAVLSLLPAGIAVAMAAAIRRRRRTVEAVRGDAAG
jgi:hypothetical protein